MVNSWSKPLRIVLVRSDGLPSENDGEPRSVWVNVEGRRTLCFRKLLSPRRDDDLKRNLFGITHPVFSLDGGYVYVQADAWATSPATHQINLTTGAERFVIDGAVQSVIRSGPYRGMLLVSRHKYHPAPEFGSYDPVDVVRPDGKLMLTVPGSEADEGDPSVANWLKAHGWQAN